MIGICTQTYDLDGARVFHQTHTSDTQRSTRRVSRTATLDGGVVIDDGGYAAGDRTIELKQTNPAQADIDFCNYVLQNYSTVILTCREGAFVVAPSQVDVDRRTGELKAVYLVKETA
jgi:hypothetical protein